MRSPYEWDPDKAEANFKKHGVHFSETEPVFEDDYAITIEEERSASEERRFVTIGTDVKMRVLVVVYCYRDEKIRIISARLADAGERRQYEEKR